MTSGDPDTGNDHPAPRAAHDRPAQRDGISTFAFAVSTSTSGWSSATTSPTATRHSTISASCEPLTQVREEEHTLLHQDRQPARRRARGRRAGGRAASSRAGGYGTINAPTRSAAPRGSKRRAPCTCAATSAPKPPNTDASWTMTRHRPVRCTLERASRRRAGSATAGRRPRGSSRRWSPCRRRRGPTARLARRRRWSRSSPAAHLCRADRRRANGEGKLRRLVVAALGLKRSTIGRAKRSTTAQQRVHVRGVRRRDHLQAHGPADSVTGLSEWCSGAPRWPPYGTRMVIGSDTRRGAASASRRG